MTDDLDLMQLASRGQKLAREGDTDYLAVHVVLAWASDGTPTVYCAYHDWHTTPIARLAAKDQELSELTALAERNAAEVVRLAAEVTRLQAQLAAHTEPPPPETPAQNQARMFAKQAAALIGEVDAPEGGKIPCDYPAVSIGSSRAGWPPTSARRTGLASWERPAVGVTTRRR